ncbi:MAG: hypothetical protein KA099_03500 [Alphaproteobacteria bacterium]|nr:hypothetical protein [Alphaproteobacteria bacterium]MBP7758475.1 hypothetical protein [Alphaproteobacteria bacterium]MBP7762756.1 hypothetical protein [Alphaproteobacteria bacterium]MBP7904370.1 hypothetical protein [Alphaproteobacteria bacterium]
MSLQFFNPWIGRMNRQQFLLGAALCGGIMFSGFHLIQEPALVVILNFICCYTIFVFVLRRLADQRPNPDVSVFYEYLSAEEAYESARANSILLARAATNFRQASHLMVLFVPMNPVVLGVLFIVVVVPLMVIVEFLAIPILITLGALVLFIMLGDGLPYANQYGHPPLGMNFKTTIPATYPDALIERFDKVMQEKQKEEQDFNDQLIALKTHRKAKTGGATQFVDFKGRG